MKKGKKIVFLSNYFNHHQKPFSDALYKILKDDYVFVENEPMSEERKRQGWNLKEIPPYVVTNEMFHENYLEYQQMINSAETVILGAAPLILVKDRIKRKNIVVRYSERPIKTKYPKWKYPFRLYTWRKWNPQYKKMVMLCASAYTSIDFKKHFLYKNKCYCWGYFPKTMEYDFESLMKMKDKKTILWCGRFLELKHPQAAVEVAKRLNDEGYNFNLNIIGSGEIENEVHDLIQNYNLTDHVKLLGIKSPEEVREYMEKSGIYLFTSDFREGWGAVLNESMNSACAVVASHAIGSVPYLIKHKENGYIYENGNLDDLYFRVKYLLDNPTEQERLGKNAYETIINQWNAENAADRFIRFVEEIKEKGQCDLYFEGPCSRAKVFKNTWFKNEHADKVIGDSNNGSVLKN